MIRNGVSKSGTILWSRSTSRLTAIAAAARRASGAMIQSCQMRQGVERVLGVVQSSLYCDGNSSFVRNDQIFFLDASSSQSNGGSCRKDEWGISLNANFLDLS